jgi:hypothetical protein
LRLPSIMNGAPICWINWRQTGSLLMVADHIFLETRHA